MIYDPFETDLAPAFVTIVVRNPGDDKCQLALSVEGRGSRLQRFLVNGSQRIGYNVSRNGRMLENEVGAPQVQLPLQSGKSDETRIELRFRIEEGEFVRAGEYTDQLALRLYQIGRGPPRQLGPETILMVSALVPSRAQVSVAGSSSQVFGANPAGSIDFGPLMTGAERQAFVQVRATSPVLLRLSSAEKGQLRHVNFGQSVQGVPYTLLVEGQRAALGQGPVELRREPNAGFRPDNYKLMFRIDDAAGRTAGLYQDVLTISVEPR